MINTRGGHLLVPIALFGGIACLLGADLASDYRAGHGPLHFVLELGAGTLALIGVAFYTRHAWSLHDVAEDLEKDLRAQEAEAQRWRAEAQNALENVGAAIDREFTKWELSEAEGKVALLLLKGLSHRHIAARRGTNEGTVRQQAFSIYRKSGLTGRSSLAAFFLEGLSLPGHSEVPDKAAGAVVRHSRS